MTNSINIPILAYRLIRGRDDAGHRLYQQDAEKIARKFLTEMFKVTTAIGGFFAISAIMNRMPTPLLSLGVGSLLMGGTVFISSQVSVILRDASLMAVGLGLVHQGLIKRSIFPIIQSVKAVLHTIKHRKSFWEIWKPTRIAPAVIAVYWRVIVGLVSLGGAYGRLSKPSEKVSKSQKPIDRFIYSRIKTTASGLAWLCGYRSS